MSFGVVIRLLTHFDAVRAEAVQSLLHSICPSLYRQ
jgi:hypothetical protein